MAGKTLRLIFTDLDGTLLDHASYDFFPALAALKAAKAAGVPVIPATSKTHAEVAELMAEIGLDGPSITENGAALHLGGDKHEALARPYAEIRQALSHLPRSLRGKMQAFGDMSVDEVASLTGLPAARAEKARARQASEPFLWHGSEVEERQLADALASLGLRMVRGGRFCHVIGAVDKAMAMGRLAQRMKDETGADATRTLALGDGPNDLAMQKAADRGIVIPNPAGHDLTSQAQDERLGLAAYPGPRGWNQAVLEWLEETG